MIYQEITKCSICGNTSLTPIIDLGVQALTGVFPRKNEVVESGPLELIKCEDCGLLQLRHNYDLNKLYGENYGYRSGLNKSMVDHLNSIVKKIRGTVELEKDDLIIDVGSNDSTLLQAYQDDKLQLVGIDPTVKKFKQFYPSYIEGIPEFFSAQIVHERFNKKAKVITSIAMFYDLEEPIRFMEQIYDVLTDDGIWVLEQSYMPMMIDNVLYDTICHEHLEYYALKQIKWMTDKVGLKIIDIEFNNVNGGSFCITTAKKNSKYIENTLLINKIMSNEENKGLSSLGIYRDFEKKVINHRNELIKFIQKVKKEKKKIFGYGASTKGNVILQFCNITKKDIPYIAEINEDKFGRYTPGTHIPIISEKEAKSLKPDYFMVLPWHFKENIISREKEYLDSGGHLLFPLPKLEIV